MAARRAHRFDRIWMRSAAKLSYAQAQAAIDGNPDDITGPLLEPVLKPLWMAYKALKMHVTSASRSNLTCQSAS
jgi:ribonuclease R